MTNEELTKALKRAYNLGQIYWQQADSEYTSQHKKADVTEAAFKELIETTVAALEAKDEPVAWVYPEFWQHLENLNCGTAYRLTGIGRQPLYTTPPQRQHITDGSPCWCKPETNYTDPETGASVIVHREPQ